MPDVQPVSIYSAFYPAVFRVTLPTGHPVDCQLLPAAPANERERARDRAVCQHPHSTISAVSLSLDCVDTVCMLLSLLNVKYEGKGPHEVTLRSQSLEITKKHMAILSIISPSQLIEKAKLQL